MPIYGFVSIQDQGKTLSAVAAVKYFCLHWGYDPREVYANIKINYPGIHAVPSSEIRQIMGRMMREEWRHKIIVIDEINTVYPARLWADKERTHELLSIWQDVKMFHRIIYTCHIGKAVDLLIRQATQFLIVPRMNWPENSVDLSVINELDLEKHQLEIPNASSYYKDYDRWQPVVA